jgi:hypothetical protein
MDKVPSTHSPTLHPSITPIHPPFIHPFIHPPTLPPSLPPSMHPSHPLIHPPSICFNSMQRFYFYKIENRFEDGEPDYDEAAPDERVRQRHPTQASHVRFGIPSLCACLSTLGCALRSKKQHRSPHPAYQPTHHRQRHLFNTRHAPSTISTRELTSSIIINLWKHSDCEGPEAPQGEGSPEEAVLPGHPPFCPAHTCTLKSRAHTHTRTHTRARAHTHTHARRTHARAHTHTHTHTHTHSYSLTLTHTHTQTHRLDARASCCL